ncbi:MAG: hypothetical protein H7Z73_08575 [Candidatus Saccharibacteria bacterium]|nr:hypothetical protein [Moraxellaceae bacterium]
MLIDPAARIGHEEAAQTAQKREVYIQTRLRQIRAWNMVGWLLWVLLAMACFWLYQQKPMYLNPAMLSAQVQIGKMPTNEILQLAALGSLIFWGFIALLVGIIFMIYTAMYSERKLIRLFESLHREDLAHYQSNETHTSTAEPSTRNIKN